MGTPFPGMDPYLENPALWSEVHSRLIMGIADAIALPLQPHYYVAVEQRTYMRHSDGDRINGPEDSILVGIPDVSILANAQAPAQEQRQEQRSSTTAATLSPASEPLTVILPMMEEIRERYLEIRDVKSGAVVTAIEVLSPTNKRVGAGRDAYLKKRGQVLDSQTHLIEIDLLRAGRSMPMQGYGDANGNDTSHYRILVSRAPQRPVAQLYAFGIRDRMPEFPLALSPSQQEPSVNLNAILDGIYNRAGYSIRVDYRQPAVPALTQDDTQWLNQVLANTSSR